MPAPNIKIEGYVLEITEPQTFGSYTKMEVIIECEPATDQWPAKRVAVTFGGKSLDKADDIAVGDEVECHAYLGSREHAGRWYHNVNGKSIKATSTVARDDADNARADKPDPVDPLAGHEPVDMDGESLPF